MRSSDAKELKMFLLLLHVCLSPGRGDKSLIHRLNPLVLLLNCTFKMKGDKLYPPVRVSKLKEGVLCLFWSLFCPSGATVVSSLDVHLR